MVGPQNKGFTSNGDGDTVNETPVKWYQDSILGGQAFRA